MKKLTLFLCAFACVTGYVFSQNPGFEKIPVPDLNTGRIDSRVAYLSDGRLVIFGGHISGFHRSNTAESWKSGELVWTQYTMNDYRDNTAIVNLGADIYLLAGGTSSSSGVGRLASTELFNGISNQFTSGASMNVARTNSRAALLSNGKALIVGNWYGDASKAEVYDPTTNAFTLTGNVITQRSSCYIVPLTDGGAIVMGGTGTHGGDIETIEFYDASANTFTEIRKTLLASESGWTYNTLFTTAMTGPEDRISGDYFYFAATKTLSGGVRWHQIFSLNLKTKEILPVVLNANDLRHNPTLGDSIAYQLHGNIYLDKQKSRIYFWGLNTKTTVGNGSRFALYSFNIATGKIHKPSEWMWLDYDPSTNSGCITSNGNIIVTGGRGSSNFNTHPYCFIAKPLEIITSVVIPEADEAEVSAYYATSNLNIQLVNLPPGDYKLHISDLSGRCVSSSGISLKKGETQLQHSVNQLRGIYLLQLTGSEGRFTTKFSAL